MDDAYRPGYHVNHEAWHWFAARMPDESACIVVGLYHTDGGCKYEFSFHWGTGNLDFATLHLHDDGFSALTDPRFASLWTALATWGLEKTPMDNRRRLTPDEQSRPASITCASWHSAMAMPITRRSATGATRSSTLARMKPGEAIRFDLDCGTYIEDEDHPLQWLAFALPTDTAVQP